MKAEYLNEVISSFATVFEKSTKEKVSKGKSIQKTEGFTTEKDFNVFSIIAGDVTGYFSFGFSTNIALKIIEKMTAGATQIDEIDELGESCIEELGAMVKGEIINTLSSIGYTCVIPKVALYKKEKVPTDIRQVGIKYPLKTNIGEIELNISLYKKDLA